MDQYHRRRTAYALRLMGSLIGALMLCIAAVHLWPSNQEKAVRLVETKKQAVLTLETVMPTRQNVAPALPPPPVVQAPPVEVPDPVVLAKEPIDLSMPVGKKDKYLKGQGLAPKNSRQAPGQAPKPVRFVEPVYPQKAQENKVRARIVVEVLVGKKGQVKGQQVVQRLLLDKEGKPKGKVDHLGYGLEEAALTAVSSWRFKPGRQEGRPVEAYARVVFSFGI